MHQNLLWICLFVVCLLDPARAQQLFMPETGTIIFSSKAPMELINAHSDQLSGLLNREEGTFAFTVQMNSFEGFNSALQQEHFCEKFMECTRYPKAIFKGKIIEDLRPNTSGKVSIRAKGKLSIHGVTQERILQVELSFGENKIDLESSFSVRLADHKIKVPTVVFEHIAEAIEVRVKAVLHPKE